MTLKPSRFVWLAAFGVWLGACAAPVSDRAVSATWQTDVIGMEEAYLDPGFWVRRLERPDRLVLDRAAIRDFNAHSFATTESLVRLDELPDRLSARELEDRLSSISRRSRHPLFYPDGTALTDRDWQRYEQSLNRAAIGAENPVRFGLVTRRADMRTYPTNDEVYRTERPTNLDRYQENALFPADAVAILHESGDGQWWFVQSYNYLAWVRREAVAVGARAEVLEFARREPFIVVTGGKIDTNYDPLEPAVSEVQLDMGVRLPIADSGETGFNVRGQNPYASYAVELPVREADGSLAIETALIGRGNDVNVGYLPYTEANVVRQAFKFLGERYGWGHSYNGRDCTGLVAEVFKTFGILLPRNSGDQGRSDVGTNRRIEPDASQAERLAALESLKIGDLIYVPGHVMMYIGSLEDAPYVIHDVNNLRYIAEDGTFYEGVLSGVSVTPMLPLHETRTERYIDLMTNIKSLR